MALPSRSTELKKKVPDTLRARGDFIGDPRFTRHNVLRGLGATSLALGGSSGGRSFLIHTHILTIDTGLC